MYRMCVFLFSLSVNAFALSDASTETRIALVIGNGDYRFSPLENPPSDARIVADALEHSGFEIIRVQNANQKKMKKAVREFSNKLEISDKAVALFYYAGHGVQVDGRNFLIPVDADIKTEADIEFESIDAQWVLDKIKESHEGLSVIVLDACRNNPFPSSTRSATRGLVRMDAPRGSLLAYSTSPGEEALDGTNGNSPYSAALASAITQPGLKLEEVFKQVRRDVLAKTKNSQVPWESSSLTDDFYFSKSSHRAEIALAHQRTEITHQKDEMYPVGEYFSDCSNCPEMMVLPPGESLIGSKPNEKGRAKNESPAFHVQLPTYAIAKTEITREQFKYFVDQSGYNPLPGCWHFKTIAWSFDRNRSWENPGIAQSLDHPVICVNWNDAKSYTEWLSRTTGNHYRLPSEAEWEYAARGGSEQIFFWGSDVNQACQYANVYDLAGDGILRSKWLQPVTCNDGAVLTRAVGQYKPNGHGLYDVIGNVMEWVDDCWFDLHDDENNGGESRRGGACLKRVQKGSNYQFTPESLRPAWRSSDEPIDRTIYTGFRVLREF